MRKLLRTDNVRILPIWVEEANQELEILRAMQKVIDNRLNTFSESIEVIEKYSRFMNNMK